GGAPPPPPAPSVAPIAPPPPPPGRAGTLEAPAGGDLSALAELLAEDVVAWSDGGGKVRAALRPVLGRKKVLAFLTGLLNRYPLESFELVDINGGPALSITAAGQRQIGLVVFRDGLIGTIYTIRNPDKLTHLSS
ncbi:hypothetical protein ACFWW0_20740, partial [Streptomyces violascens]